jgi:hypothetical protein
MYEFAGFRGDIDGADEAEELGGAAELKIPS